MGTAQQELKAVWYLKKYAALWMKLAEMRSLHGNAVGNVIRLLRCHTLSFSSVRTVKMQLKWKNGTAPSRERRDIFCVPKASPAGWRAPSPWWEASVSEKSPLTLMCFDGCSASLSPTCFKKLQPQTIIYLLGRFHVSEMFSHKCTYCAPASQLFLLQLCHSSMSLHSFSVKRKERGGKRTRGRDGG